MHDHLSLPVLSEDGRANAQNGLDRLTPRERQVAQGIVDGATNKETALKLGISPRTVEVHRRRIFQKLGIRGAAALVRFVATSTGAWTPQHEGDATPTWRGPGPKVGAHKAAGPAISSEINRSDVETMASAPGGLDRTGSAQMADIITGIAYTRQPDADAINVFMMWDNAAMASGYLLVPEAVQRELQDLRYPPPDLVRPINNAISYGLFLALLVRRPLHLTGEQRVWSDDWGILPSTSGPERRPLM